MALTLLTENLIEASTATVTVSPAAASGKPITRVFDRRKSLQYEGGSVAQTDIDVDLASAKAVTAWALLNHNITGVTVTLFGDSVTPPVAVQDSFAPAGADFLRTFASQSFRYWRVRIPVMASAPKLGEWFLGTHFSISNPSWGAAESQRGNVERDESPGGFVWKARRGSERYELAYRWQTMLDADWTNLLAAYDQTLQSGKLFPMIDQGGTLRWVEFKEKSLVRRRNFTNANEVDVIFLAALS